VALFRAVLYWACVSTSLSSAAYYKVVPPGERQLVFPSLKQKAAFFVFSLPDFSANVMKIDCTNIILSFKGMCLPLCCKTHLRWCYHSVYWYLVCAKLSIMPHCITCLNQAPSLLLFKQTVDGLVCLLAFDTPLLSVLFTNQSRLVLFLFRTNHCWSVPTQNRFYRHFVNNQT